MSQNRPQEERPDPAVASAIDEIVAELSRLRSRIDALGLPASDAHAELTTHLTLASMAALRLRFNRGEDDIFAEDS
jgi:hypothetical protein